MNAPVTSESPRSVWELDMGRAPLRHECDMLDQHEGREGSEAEMGDDEGPLPLA
jgi:hypothetical protein